MDTNMRTPVPSEPRTFSLKDDTCFSGIRASAHPELVEGPNDRPLILSLSKDGGGYINLTAPPVPSASRGRLIPAHGFIPVPVVGSAPGEIAVPPEPLRSS